MYLKSHCLNRQVCSLGPLPQQGHVELSRPPSGSSGCLDEGGSWAGLEQSSSHLSLWAWGQSLEGSRLRAGCGEAREGLGCVMMWETGGVAESVSARPLHSQEPVPRETTPSPPQLRSKMDRDIQRPCQAETPHPPSPPRAPFLAPPSPTNPCILLVVPSCTYSEPG